MSLRSTNVMMRQKSRSSQAAQRSTTSEDGVAQLGRYGLGVVLRVDDARPRRVDPLAAKIASQRHGDRTGGGRTGVRRPQRLLSLAVRRAVAVEVDDAALLRG